LQSHGIDIFSLLCIVQLATLRLLQIPANTPDPRVLGLGELRLGSAAALLLLLLFIR
jgi:hypothetical protein